MLNITNPDLADLLSGRSGSFTASQLDAVREIAASKKLELPDREFEGGSHRHRSFKAGRPGTLLASKIEALTKYIPGLKGGCARCKNLMEQMDRQGWRWCKENRNNLIQQIVNNAANAHKWIPASLASLVTDTDKFRDRVAAVLDEAISESAKKTLSSILQSPSNSRQALLNSPTIPTEVIPFTESPRLTLMFHVWPHGDGWKRHVEKLQPVLHRFDRLILGVATDESTATVDEVWEAFGERWEIVAVENDPSPKTGLREVATYREILSTLPNGVNDITFCAHAKGAQSHTAASEPVTWWTDAMYEAILYNVDGVIDEIRNGAAIVGSFRRHGKYLGTKYKWHYSGTFYAFRNAIAFSNGVPSYRSRWWGTESWPGDHFPIESSACIFGDRSNDLYKRDQQPRTELEQWKIVNGDLLKKG